MGSSHEAPSTPLRRAANLRRSGEGGSSGRRAKKHFSTERLRTRAPLGENRFFYSPTTRTKLFHFQTPLPSRRKRALPSNFWQFFFQHDLLATLGAEWVLQLGAGAWRGKASSSQTGLWQETHGPRAAWLRTPWPRREGTSRAPLPRLQSQANTQVAVCEPPSITSGKGRGLCTGRVHVSPQSVQTLQSPTAELPGGGKNPFCVEKGLPLRRVAQAARGRGRWARGGGMPS